MLLVVFHERKKEVNNTNKTQYIDMWQYRLFFSRVNSHVIIQIKKLQQLNFQSLYFSIFYYEYVF